MVTSHPGSKKLIVKPLFFKTPIYDDESIASWLIRAAFRQGCSLTTFTSYYWEDYRLWVLDVDKGFNNVHEHIHVDMAVLAETNRERFDFHNLVFFAQNMTTSPGKNRNIPWVLPLYKRNRHALYGYYYCPICLAEDTTPYMRLLWRYSWYTYCHIHAVRMECHCFTCGALYQPNLLTPQLQMLDRCHSCLNKVTKGYLTNLSVISETYTLQAKALQVLHDRQIAVFGESINSAEWFDLIGFFILLTRQAARQAERQHKMFKLFNELGIDTTTVSVFTLRESELGNAFEQLPIYERIRFLRYASILSNITLEKWLIACKTVGVNQNSFMFNGKKSLIPKGFLPIYTQLPTNNNNRKRKTLGLDKPASLTAVKKSWARLQRRANARAEYEQHILRK